MKEVLKAWFLVFLWCGVIFYFSSQPNLKLSWGFWDLILRKISHMLEFGILAFLLFRALKLSFRKMKKIQLYFSAGFFSLVYAFCDEFHQGFVPTRQASFKDVAIDLVGILVALVLIKRFSLSATASTS